MNPFSIRSATGDDISFIYSTWLNSFRNDSNTGKSTTKSVFYDTYRLVLDAILASPTTRVLVACKPDEEHVIFAYLISEPTESIIHYAFTKKSFMNLGIQRALFATVFPGQGYGSVSVTHTTHSITELSKKFTYNPFLLYRRE